MTLTFNRILKPDFKNVLPFIQELTQHQNTDEVLLSRFDEMFTQNYECFEIKYNEESIGVFGLWFMTRHYIGKSCEPDHIYIDPSYRRQGFGKKVFHWIYKYALTKGCEAMELNTYVSNFASHKFYHNEGFETWAYHMVKVLKDKG
ncbi:GNAT family N-acetyltransferase [Aquimarina sp. ERC-38]|uniref:GNAT family N-acetyltransferase n=1 Tax=Aquimarina sp. ERC-38 TaxID=2949996 RepID=UPI0022467F36|nr:GNAT family N-acetyltransferase [Aquimarina sp. ERC-38]UZO82585.1 GNAT family N-acetyltransferase [Aquimarina sp. ERC-38]